MTKIKDIKTTIYKWEGEVVHPSQNFCTNQNDLLREKVDKMKSVVHFNNTSRIQMVSNETNEMYHRLLKNLESITDTPGVMNTSFNLKGQPIVETPRDAIMTFFGCGLDALIIGYFVVKKKNTI